MDIREKPLLQLLSDRSSKISTVEHLITYAVLQSGLTNNITELVVWLISLESLSSENVRSWYLD